MERLTEMMQSIKIYCQWRLNRGLDMSKIPTCLTLLPFLKKQKEQKRKYTFIKKIRCKRCKILLDSKFAGRHDGKYCEDCIIAIHRNMMPVDKLAI